MLRYLLAASSLSLFLVCGRASEVMIGFEGPPVQPSGTHYAMAQYDEAGYHFQPLGPLATQAPYHMGRVGPATSNRPNNGTTHLALLSQDSCKITRIGGSAFDALRIDLAEYSTVFSSPQTFTFTGRKADASTVSVTFTTDGVVDGTGSLVDYQTFTFPDTFRGLVSLETESFGSYDNLVLQPSDLVVTPDPEPEPEPETPRRWMDAVVTISGVLDTESAFVTSGAYRRTTPLKTRFGNKELIDHLVSAGLLPEATGWSLKCVYDARFASDTTGAFSFVAVHTSGERVPLNEVLYLEPLAQVLNGRLRVAATSSGAFGSVAENRFYRLVVTLPGATEARGYGGITNNLVVKTDAGEPVGVIASFKLKTTGHADTDALAAITLGVGKFRVFVPPAAE